MTLALCGLLLLLVAVAFGQSAGFDFVNWDDGQCVYDNPHVTGGLSWKEAGWAFTNRDAGIWAPLCWLSHMLDCQVWGLTAGGHHLTNVLLHAATAILLFLLLRQMTGRPWPSVLAAALFAVHPLRAESVAWVTERRDVLSGLFFMLTLWAYIGYARHRFSVGRYLLVLVCFALGLMAKPTLAAMPLLLPLLDYWPLGRMTIKPPGVMPTLAVGMSRMRDEQHMPTASVGMAPGITPPPQSRRVMLKHNLRLLLEKLPLAAMAGACLRGDRLGRGQRPGSQRAGFLYGGGSETPWLPTRPTWASFSIPWAWPRPIPAQGWTCRRARSLRRPCS